MSSCSWKLSAAIAVTLAASSCTTTEQANSALDSRFRGKSADSFFLAYGPPSSSYKLNSGGTLYTWQERAKVYNLPDTVNTTIIGNQAFSTVDPGGRVHIQCTLKLNVSASGTIEKIDVLNDSIGDWQMSRCNEVFGKKKPK